MKKRFFTAVALALLLALGLPCAVAEGLPSREALLAVGYFPIGEVMALAGYVPVGEEVYRRAATPDLMIEIAFDAAEESCAKNQYRFDLSDQFRRSDGALCLSAKAFSAVLNCEVVVRDGEIELSPIHYAPHAWTEVSRIITHAGGAVRDADFYSVYTNSLEALVENYNLGQRVFEFDFDLTSDGRLACLHDWTKFGLRNGNPMSLAEWKASKTYGNPVTRGRFTPMTEEDVLDQMLVNGDMFLVTDTKSMHLSDGDVVRVFEMLRDAALARDPALLDRIVVQVYDPNTWALTLSTYPWRSVIYTTYGNELPAEEILDFAEAHDEIRVVTASYKDKRFGEAEIRRVHDSGRLFYVHTLNTYDDLMAQRARGVDGLYSDLLQDRDMALYDQAAARAEAARTDGPIAPEDLYFLSLKEVASGFIGALDYAGGLEDCAVLLSVCGDGAQGLNDEKRAALQRLGLQTDFSQAVDRGYCAVIDGGVREELGDAPVALSGTLSDGAEYALSSAGTDVGNASSIMINGKEFSPNKTGFNIVVYNTALHTVIHQGSYNTHK